MTHDTPAPLDDATRDDLYARLVITTEQQESIGIAQVAALERIATALEIIAAPRLTEDKAVASALDGMRSAMDDMLTRLKGISG